MKKLNKFILIFVALFSMVIFSCKDNILEGEDWAVFDLQPVGLFLNEEQHEGNFSLWLEILKTTGFYNSFNLNGAYTCFVPDNEAVNSFLDGKTVDQMDVEFLKTLVKYHTLNVMVDATNFSDGALPDTTFSGDYLVVEFGEGGFNNILINQSAKVTQSNLNVKNGIIHVIDKVLDPVFETVYEKLKSDSRFSIFTQAMEITGISNTVNDIYLVVGDRSLRQYFTAFAVSDETFSNYNIGSIEELKSYISPDNSDYTNPSNELYKYIGYHILKGAHFYNDLGTFSGSTNNKLIETLTQNELVLVEELDGEILINRDTESGNEVRMSQDDYNISAKNGAIHLVDNLMPIFLPPQVNFIWEVTDIPECRALPGYQQYVTTGVTMSHEFDEPEDVEQWNWYSVPDGASAKYTTRYRKSGGDIYNGLNFDYLDFAIPRGGTGSVELSTPAIIKGKYKVFIRANHSTGRAVVQAYVGGNKVGAPVSLNIGGNKWIEFEVGLVNFANTGNQKIRFAVIKNTKFQLDYIRFEPFEEEDSNSN